MKTYQQLLGIITIVLTSGCATGPTEQLAEGASKVTVLSEVTLADLEKLKKIGSGTCQIGMNVRSVASNMETCKNYLRNEAANKNADYIVFVSSSKSGITTASLEADFYRNK